MKLVSQSPERLVIEDRPWLVWLLLYGMGAGAVISALTGRTDGLGETLLVLALGLGMLWVTWKFLPLQRFTFDRPGNSFTHEVVRLTGRQSWTRPLSEFQRAARQSDGDATPSHRVALITEHGQYPLEAGFTGLDRRKITDAINAWLGV